MLADLGDTWVLTRPFEDQRSRIEARLPDVPERHRLHFVFVDLPRWIPRRWSRGAPRRLVRVQYLLWQMAALRAARRLNRRHHFDLAWHVTWANVWIGSTAALVGPRFVYGPVGGGVNPPWRLVPSLGWRGAVAEGARWLIRQTARYLNPLARVSWQRASLILAQNPESVAWLPRAVHAKTVVFTNAVIEDVPTGAGTASGAPAREHTALFAGRLVAWKGAALAIAAIASLPEFRLVICGEGPEQGRLRLLAGRLGLDDRVEFRGQVPRDELLRVMREETDVLLFPSLHDDGPWAVAEALASGLPVVCLDRGGPAALGGIQVQAGDYRTTVARLAEAVRRAQRPGATPPFDRASRRAALLEILRARRLCGEAGNGRHDLQA
jgi:glycosyltransferase involved in cell wall biosynthesis